MALNIYADSFSGLQAGRANQEAQRQQALQVGFAHLMRGLESAARRKEVQEAVAREQQRYAVENAYRDKVFNEQVRQFDVSSRAARPVSMVDIERMIRAGVDMTAEQRARLAAERGLTPAEAAMVESQVLPVQEEQQREHVVQAQGADLLNTEAPRRAIMAEQLAGAKEYPSTNRGRFLTGLMGVPGMVASVMGWNPFGGRPEIEADIAAGVARQQQDLTGRVGRVERQDLVQNPSTGTWEPITPPAPDRTPWTRRVPTRAPMVTPAPAAPSLTVARPQAVNSYMPGRRYGNLRYLGGDPFSEASWAPIGQAAPVMPQRPTVVPVQPQYAPQRVLPFGQEYIPMPDDLY